MARETEGLIRELLELSRCPCDLTVFSETPGMEEEMAEYWEEVADKHDLDLYDDLEATIDRSDVGPNDMKILALQRDVLKTKVGPAREEYERAIRRFFQMRVADEGDWRKHYTTAGEERRAIIQRTEPKRSASLFYPEVTPKALLRVLHDLFELNWRDFLAVPHVRLWVDVMEKVGASGGQETDLVLFDVDFSTPMTHAFPVLREDKKSDDAKEPWLSTDILQGLITPSRTS